MGPFFRNNNEGSLGWRAFFFAIAYLPLLGAGIHGFPEDAKKATGSQQHQAKEQPATGSTASLSERIDQIVAADYLGPTVPLASDTEFHRRIYLDLLGRGPTGAETEAFLDALRKQPAASREVRRSVIDDLLGREEFSRYFAKVLDVMFTERREVIGLLEFRAWLRECLEARKPLNEICLEVLSADGTGEKLRPAAAFFLNRNAEPNQVTRDVGRIFLGRDLQCAQCHDHPHHEDYKQSEYFGLLSFVNRTYLFQDEKQGNKPFLGERAEGALEYSSVFKPKAGKSEARPVLPLGFAADLEPDFLDQADAYIVKPEKGQRGVPRYSRRQQLAVLVTHPENALFNRNLANRLWAALMGMGLVHPVDLHHPGNPPVSAELLRVLAEGLVSARYDLREFVRQVARSDAYQRSVSVPDLDAWAGPAGGIPGLKAEMAKLDGMVRALAPERSRLEKELATASARVQKVSADLEKVQRQLDGAAKELQQLATQRSGETGKLDASKKKQAQGQEAVTALQSAIRELEKLGMLSPGDKEIGVVKTTLAGRLSAANQAKQATDAEVKTLEEALKSSAARVEDLRGRLLVLANRKIPLAGFVSEARGGLRRAHGEMLALQDRESDLGQRKSRLAKVVDWLHSREALLSARKEAKPSGTGPQETQLRLTRSDLVESWRRSHAIRRLRGLNGDQMGGAIYHALGLDQPARDKASAEWEKKQGKDPASDKDGAKRREHLASAVAGNLWDLLEKDVMRRFSAPPGAPQDGFIASVDQALMLQNDPKVQAWFKPEPGTLTHRLAGVTDPDQVVRQAYLAVLARLPYPDEAKAAKGLLEVRPMERGDAIRELVWGLLASAEFRFIP